jgi:hypothetical protein
MACILRTSLECSNTSTLVGRVARLEFRVIGCLGETMVVTGKECTDRTEAQIVVLYHWYELFVIEKREAIEAQNIKAAE